MEFHSCHFFINIYETKKILIHADFRSERTRSVGRAVSLLVAKTVLLWGLTCHSNPTGVTALHGSQLREYRKHKFK